MLAIMHYLFRGLVYSVTQLAWAITVFLSSSSFANSRSLPMAPPGDLVTRDNAGVPPDAHVARKIMTGILNHFCHNVGMMDFEDIKDMSGTGCT